MKTEQKCRVCGCTEDRACKGGCTWIEPGLCSQCEGKEAKIDVEALEGVTKLTAGSGKRILGVAKEKYCSIDCSLAIPKQCQGDCCGMVPFYKDFVMKHKPDAKREIIKIIEIDVMTVILETKDLMCTFLDDDFRCSVYEDRPEVCKKFGDASHPALICPYIKPNGKLRSKKGRIITRKKIDKFVDQFEKDAKKVVDN